MTTNACHQRLRGKERSRGQEAYLLRLKDLPWPFYAHSPGTPGLRAPCALPCPATLLGSQGWRLGAAFPQPADQKQPHPPASRMQACLQPTPAPDCGLSRGQDRTQGTDVPILWLPTSFLKKSRSQPSSIHL